MVKISELPAVTSVTTSDLIPLVQNGVTARIDVQNLITSGGFTGATGATGPTGPAGPAGPSGSGGLEGSISVTDFGATGDGITDDHGAIQDAIDYALENDITVVTIPQGEYVTSATIMLGYGYSFATIQLLGMGRGPGEAAEGDMATLKPTFVNRPVVAIQGGRNSGISNISIVGPISIIENSDISALGPVLRADRDNYTPTGAQTYWKAPFCGVAIDPYSGTLPSTSYPLVALPSFLGQGSNITYGRSNTSTGFVHRCKISHTYIGIMNQSNSDQNGDFLDFEGTRIDYQAIGVSCGNINARSTNFSHMNFYGVHTVFDGATNAVDSGTRGQFIGSYDNIHTNQCYRIFFLDSSWTSKFVVNNMYSEGLHKIGSVSSFTGGGPVFIGCDFRFENQFLVSGGSVSEAYVEDVCGSAMFIDCYLRGMQAVMTMDDCIFDGCLIWPYSYDVSGYEVTGGEATGRNMFLGVMTRPNVSGTMRAPPSNLSRFRRTVIRNYSGGYDGYDNDAYQSWHSVGAIHTSNSSHQMVTPYVVGQLARSSLSVSALPGTVVGTPTETGRSILCDMTSQISVGDVILSVGTTEATWFFVESVTANGSGRFDTLLTAYNNYQFVANDGSAANLLSHSGSAGASSYWTLGSGASITTDAALDPRSAMKADTLLEGTGSDPALYHGVVPITASGEYTWSREVRAINRATVTMRLYANDFGSEITGSFNVSTGVLNSSSATGGATLTNAAITSLGGGWYRVEISGTHPSDVEGVYCWTNFFTPTPVLGQEAHYLGGAQFEAGSPAGTYHEQIGTYSLFNTDTPAFTARNSFYFPKSVIFDPTQADAFVTTKGSATVECIDSAGASKAIPSDLATGRGAFYYGSTSLAHLKTYLPFPPSTTVVSLSSNSFVMSAPAQRTGIYRACAGLCPNLLYM
jgi:hypothetical protein